MKLHIIIGSTRQGRQTDKLAKWVANEASNMQDVSAEVVDLADHPMPLFDEAVSPQYNPDRKPTGAVKTWLDKVAEADAYVLVTPEYNRSTSGVLKNALDYLDFQMAKKPVALVAHGGTGGAQAVSHLRGIIPQLQAVSIPNTVYFSSRVSEVISDEGELSEELKQNPYGPQASLKSALEQLHWFSDALVAAQKTT
jgi:NAD(P)H-dependent FMN reductase